VLSHFAQAFSLEEYEPILVHLTKTQLQVERHLSEVVSRLTHDQKAQSPLTSDPLAGQGFHQDGCVGVGVVVIQRDNCKGAKNYVSFQTGEYITNPKDHLIFEGVLEFGEGTFVMDEEASHAADLLEAEDPRLPAQRTIMSMTTRFLDPLQVEELKATQTVTRSPVPEEGDHMIQVAIPDEQKGTLAW